MTGVTFGFLSGTGLSTDKTEASRATQANANGRLCPLRRRLGVTVLAGFAVDSVAEASAHHAAG